MGHGPRRAEDTTFNITVLKLGEERKGVEGESASKEHAAKVKGWLSEEVKPLLDELDEETRRLIGTLH